MAAGSFKLPVSGSSSNTTIVWTQGIQDTWFPGGLPTYTRPPDWTAMPALTNGDKKIVILHKVDNVLDGTFAAFTISGDYTVDWGDGTGIQNFAAGVTAEHKYLWANVSSGTLTSEGYRQALITITPQAGQNLTSVNFDVKPSTNALGVVSGILDMKVASQQCTSFNLSSVSANVKHSNISEFEWIGTHSLTSYAYMFTSCVSLRKVTMPTTSNGVTSTASMFQGCASLILANLFYTNAVTNAASMFQGCTSIIALPLYNFGLVTNGSNLFNGCYSLEITPFFNFASLTNGSWLFAGCKALIAVPLFNFALVTNGQDMFYSCSRLTTIPLFNFSSLTNGRELFFYCQSVISFPAFNFSALIDADRLFCTCSSVTTFPYYDFSNVTIGDAMFDSCYTLQSVPQYNFSKVTTAIGMFQLCYTLKTIPDFGFTSALTATTQMFQQCWSLISVPFINTSNVTVIGGMFLQCYSLISVPLFDFSKVVYGDNVFSQCTSLITVPNFNFAAINDASSMFQYCSALQYVPNFNMGSAIVTVMSMFDGCSSLLAIPLFAITSVGQNVINMVRDCVSLISMPAYDFSPATTNSDPFSGNTALADINIKNVKTNISVSGTSMGNLALEKFFATSLSNNVSVKTVTISNTWGSTGIYAPVVKATSGTTSGSAVVTQTNTSGLAVGQVITVGAGIIGVRTCAATLASNLFTLTAHGLTDGKTVSITALGTLTGLTIKTLYYVVGSTANTFQISATLGGTPITLSGTTVTPASFNIPVFITAITTNTNFTLSTTATATASVSVTARLLNTNIAAYKGWTVSG